jgi:ferredoxin-NADP reductase
VTDAIGQALYVPWQEAVIERIERQTARVKSFFVRPREWRSFRAGQHLDVRLTAPDGYQVQRSYSVASAPGLEGLYEIDVERLDDGEVSPFFDDVAEVGDAIEIRARSAVTSRGALRTVDHSFSSAVVPGSRR